MKRRQHGSAIVGAIWILAVLSILIATYAVDAQLQTRINLYLQERVKVDHLTDAGIAIAEVIMLDYQNVSVPSSTGSDGKSTTASQSEVDEYREKASSKEWIFSKVSKFDYVFDNRFSFGSVQILLSIENDEIQSVQVFTDSMDTELPQKLQSRLIGLTFDKKTVIDALSSEGSSVFIDISDKFAEAF